MFVFALDYDAHEGCPDRAAFVEQVVARASARFDDHGAPVSVRIVREGSVSVGELVLDGGKTRRGLRGASCADVVSGLAFAFSLSLDGRQVPEEKPSEPPPVPVVPAVTRDVPLVVPPERRMETSTAIGFATTASAWGTEATMIGPWGRVARERLSLRIGGLYGSSRVDRARFRRALLAVDGCYGTFVAGCAGLEGGLLRADGVGVVEASSASRGWLAPTTSLRVEARPVAALVIEARAGLAFPLVRDTFALAPSTTLFRASAVAPFAGLAIAVTIP